MAIRNLPVFIVSAVVLVFGIATFALAVSGALWTPATKPTDLGLMSLTVVSVLIGIVGLLVSRFPAPEAQP